MQSEILYLYIFFYALYILTPKRWLHGSCALYFPGGIHNFLKYEHLFIYQLFLAVPGHKTPLPAPAGTQIHLGGRAGPE